MPYFLARNQFHDIGGFQICRHDFLVRALGIRNRRYETPTGILQPISSMEMLRLVPMEGSLAV